MRGQLGLIAAILAIGVMVVYGWRLLAGGRAPSPESLAEAALIAPTAAERERAAVQLTQLGRPAHEHLVRLLGESAEPEVRAACIRGLAEQWHYDSVPVLLDALEDESSLVRGQAGAAVEHLLRVDYNYRADAPPEQRREVVRRLRAWWEKFQRSNMCREFMRQMQAGDEP